MFQCQSWRQAMCLWSRRKVHQRSNESKLVSSARWIKHYNCRHRPNNLYPGMSNCDKIARYIGLSATNTIGKIKTFTQSRDIHILILVGTSGTGMHIGHYSVQAKQTWPFLPCNHLGRLLLLTPSGISWKLSVQRIIS